MKYEWFIAKRYLTSRPQHAFITVIAAFASLGVAVGVAALIVTLSVMNGFGGEVRDRIIGTTAHLAVYTVLGRGMPEADAPFDVVAADPDVVATAPFIFGKGAIAGPESTDGILIRGIDPGRERDVTDVAKRMIEGSFDVSPDSSGLGGILLGLNLASRLGVAVGDHATLFTVSERATAAPRAMNFVVRGVFETGMYEYDDALALISISDAQAVFKMPGLISGIAARTRDPFSARFAADRLNEKLGAQYVAEDWTRAHKNLFAWMALEKWAAFVVLSLIVAVAAFNIITGLSMQVLAKTRDVGVLLALGATRGAVRRVFLLTGGGVGLVGTLLGVAGGLALCWAQNTFGLLRLPGEIYFINRLPVEVHALDVALTAVAAFALCVAAALYPASRAGRLSPVSAIRHE